MSIVEPGLYPGAVPVVAAPSNTVAYVAIFLAIIAIIIVIVIVFIIFTQSSAITNLLDSWIVINGTTNAADSFTASPNTIFVVNAGAPAGYTLTVNGFAGIAAEVVAGARTTIFIIDATSSTVPVKVVGGTSNGTTVTIQTTPVSGALIQAGQIGWYYWSSPTMIKRFNTTST